MLAYDVFNILLRSVLYQANKTQFKTANKIYDFLIQENKQKILDIFHDNFVVKY